MIRADDVLDIVTAIEHCINSGATWATWVEEDWAEIRSLVLGWKTDEWNCHATGVARVEPVERK